MIVLGLDCATKTGWALADGKRIIESGVQEFTVKRGESPGMRFLRFRKWTEELIRNSRPDVVVYEQAHYRGGAATELCVGFVTRVQEAASAHGVNYQGMHTATVKKTLTGHGKGDKEAVIKAVQARTGIKPIDDNHADAIALCLCMAEEI